MSAPDPDLEKLRESYLASLRESGPGSGDPPDADRIWDAVSGVLPPEERREVVDRAAADPAWAEALLLASAIWNETPRQSSFWKDYRYLAAAASLAAMLAGGFLLRDVLAPGPEYRQPGGASIESLVPEDERLPREELVLRWTELDPDARYEVTVTTESLEIVSTGRDLDAPEYRVPAADLSDLPPGTRILWQVTSRPEEGAEVRSETFFATLE